MTEIYGITGMPLSGKTTVAEILEQKKGFSVLDMGEIVRIEMKKRDIKPGKEAGFVNGLREEQGMDAVAQLCIPYLKEILEEKDKIVITGMRGWSEKERFEEEISQNVDIIAVWASRQTRKDRRDDRKREEDLKGQDFHKRDLREVENGMGKLISLSDHMVKNDEITLEKLEKKVIKIVD